METETLDKLYLEWSQFTSARTSREIAYKDVAEMLWVVLANVSEGDWKKQTPEWQAAAARWRDAYFAVDGPI